jgi:hypothetical protein
VDGYNYTVDAWIEAFSIFKKYKPGLIEIGAEHEILYVGVKPEVVNSDDAARLKELGWHKEDRYECYAKYF